MLVDNGQTSLGFDEMLVGNEQISLGFDEMFVGDEQISLGFDEMFVGDEQISLGFDEMFVGNERISLGVHSGRICVLDFPQACCENPVEKPVGQRKTFSDRDLGISICLVCDKAPERLAIHAQIIPDQTRRSS
jgi:hypothetical protein